MYSNINSLSSLDSDTMDVNHSFKIILIFYSLLGFMHELLCMVEMEMSRCAMNRCHSILFRTHNVKIDKEAHFIGCILIITHLTTCFDSTRPQNFGNTNNKTLMIEKYKTKIEVQCSRGNSNRLSKVKSLCHDLLV